MSLVLPHRFVQTSGRKSAFAFSEMDDRLHWPETSETTQARQLESEIRSLDWKLVQQQAGEWIRQLRATPAHPWAVDRLLQEYPIHSQEGLALMRLAEALLRVPDLETASTLLGDQLGDKFQSLLTRRWLPEDASETGLSLSQKLGAQGMLMAARRSLQLLSLQFVTGQTIDEAIKRAQRMQAEGPLLRFSFDMLGEGARCEAQAAQYAGRYAQALYELSHRAAVHAESNRQRRSAVPAHVFDGVSIKLSALHPRFEALQIERVLQELLPRIWNLCDTAAKANLPLTIDAEESDRLEPALVVFENLSKLVAEYHPNWQGLGIAVQAYQTRAVSAIQAILDIARHSGLQIMVRLVKGAYWDSEIKRAQELGLSSYPVFTHKSHTDLSYLACARMLLEASDCVYPQFATHNAATIAAILQMSKPLGESPFEFQRLHGMGEDLYKELARTHAYVPLRVYAPVGEHKDLLAYLVRRLLENGAASSFVHLLVDPQLDLDTLLSPPSVMDNANSVVAPPELYWPRLNSLGLDLSRSTARSHLMLAYAQARPQQVPDTSLESIPAIFDRAREAGLHWGRTSSRVRCQVLLDGAEALQRQLPHFASLLVRESRKTWADAVAEVRESIDYLRYYAHEAEKLEPGLKMPQQGTGLTGETNVLRWNPSGVWICISPWNFPLALFIGQVAAALVTGNSVLAKPAEQTPFIATATATLLEQCGLPKHVLQIVCGPGETVGEALIQRSGLAGIAFTGSTSTAKQIQLQLARKPGPIVPFIAETGGINAMLVDSTALPEQVVDSVLQSAFKSAGQRCSSLRLLCLHEPIADSVLSMLKGAASELHCTHPAKFSCDVPPLIDWDAQASVERHLANFSTAAALSDRLDASVSNLMPPHLIEIRDPSELTREVFGPVLHVMRWKGSAHAVIDQINDMGYGLTFGIQTRIESRAREWAARIRSGNVYVNRNMIGAVVGLQPFGGQALSGTGRKAGGPCYLQQFCSEQVITVNTAAAGGNVLLMAEGESPISSTTAGFDGAEQIPAPPPTPPATR